MGDHDMSDEHSHSPRTMEDGYLRDWSVRDLYDLAGECPVEPADEKVCDACAAYLIAQDKEREERATPAPTTMTPIPDLPDRFGVVFPDGAVFDVTDAALLYDQDPEARARLIADKVGGRVVRIVTELVAHDG